MGRPLQYKGMDMNNTTLLQTGDHVSLYFADEPNEGFIMGQVVDANTQWVALKNIDMRYYDGSRGFFAGDSCIIPWHSIDNIQQGG